ncbi:MAG: hypothetical protein WC511_00480 [Candidatus Pacearchaeota archaeon]
MLFETSTGRIDLSAYGETAFIKRKDGEKVKIPSSEILMKLYKKANETQNQKDFEKCREFQDNFPKIKEGDVFMTGKDSLINLSCNYNRGKDKPIEGYKNQETKNIFIGGNGAEAKIVGLESWSREDKKTKTKYFGTSIKGYEILKEGFFYCSYLNTDGELITPIANIKFGSKGANISIDFYKGILYTVPILSSGIKNEHGNVEFILKKSKKSYKDDSEMIKEIIVTSDGIYKKSMIKMDPIDYMIGTKLISLTNISEMPVLKKEQITGQPKKMTETMKQAQVSMEMFKKLSPSEITELGKSEGATPEQIKQMIEGAEALKTMETKMPMEEMNKAFAKMNAYYEGMDDTGIESMMKLQTKGQKIASEYNAKTKNEVLKMLSSPRKYSPLTSEFKVA